MNHQIILAARPDGLPKETDFKRLEAPVPELGERQFLVKNIYLSVDPYMRGRISEIKSYAEPVAVGDVMVGGTVAALSSQSTRSTRRAISWLDTPAGRNTPFRTARRCSGSTPRSRRCPPPWAFWGCPA